MNTKQKVTKSISVILLVALAAFATTGLVLADHIAPVESVGVSRMTSFEQYQAVMDHMEEDQAAAFARLNASRFNRMEVFKQYNQAIAEMQREQEARKSALSQRANDESQLFWDQYFMYAK